jgi:ABC-2 type transport system ATP-binding protein
MIDAGKIIAHDTLAGLMKTHQQDGLEGLFLNLTGKDYRN